MTSSRLDKNLSASYLCQVRLSIDIINAPADANQSETPRGPSSNGMTLRVHESYPRPKATNSSYAYIGRRKTRPIARYQSICAFPLRSSCYNWESYSHSPTYIGRSGCSQRENPSSYSPGSLSIHQFFTYNVMSEFTRRSTRNISHDHGFYREALSVQYSLYIRATRLTL